MNKFLNHSAVFLLLLSTQSVNAQEDREEENFFEDYFVGAFMSDRPGQALAPRTCGALAIQVQAGYQFIKQKTQFNYLTHHVPLDIRLGLSPRLEINTSFYYQYQNINSTPNMNARDGFLSPNLGARISLLKSRSWKPAVGIQANMSFASDQGDYQQTQMGSSFYLIVSHKLDWFSVNTNWGLLYRGNGSGQARYPYVVNCGFQMNKKWSSFVEIYGIFNDIDNTINYDAGFAYTPIKNFQLDIFGGWLNNDFSGEHWFVQAGFTYKFSLLKKLTDKDD